MRIIVAGDFCDRYRVSELIAKGEYGVLFDDVAPIIKHADYGIVNFEFPIVNDVAFPISKCGPNLRGQRAAIDAIKHAGFNVCTLANNHILDQGALCCIETKRFLEESGMMTVGVGTCLSDANSILYLHKDSLTIAIINCCEHEFSIATETASGANPLDPVRQYYAIREAREKSDYVFVIVHGGREHFQLPTMRMKDIFHFFIDCGADVVVNHHQHCYSGIEMYQSKPIFYGIGNFCFDDPAKKGNWNYGYMVEFEFGESINYKIYPYSQCLESPSVTLLSAKENYEFSKQLDVINRIIKDDALLTHSVNSSYLDNYERQLFSLEPYSLNKVLDKLFTMKVLPSTLSKKRLLKLLNTIECESLRDQLIAVLKYKINSINE